MVKRVSLSPYEIQYGHVFNYDYIGFFMILFLINQTEFSSNNYKNTPFVVVYWISDC
jgi:hypothetical protein